MLMVMLRLMVMLCLRLRLRLRLRLIYWARGRSSSVTLSRGRKPLFKGIQRYDSGFMRL